MMKRNATRWAKTRAWRPGARKQEVHTAALTVPTIRKEKKTGISKYMEAPIIFWGEG